MAIVLDHQRPSMPDLRNQLHSCSPVHVANLVLNGVAAFANIKLNELHTGKQRIPCSKAANDSACNCTTESIRGKQRQSLMLHFAHIQPRQASTNTLRRRPSTRERRSGGQQSGENGRGGTSPQDIDLILRCLRRWRLVNAAALVMQWSLTL